MRYLLLGMIIGLGLTGGLDALLMYITGRTFASIAENVFYTIMFFIAFYIVLIKLRIKKRKIFIKNYLFPDTLNNKILAEYPHLLESDLVCIKKELKVFFDIHICQGELVAMPSRVVDVAWHEFILHTKDYHYFCDKAYGHYLHHNPFSKKISSQDIKESLQRTWIYSCKKKT